MSKKTLMISAAIILTVVLAGCAAEKDLKIEHDEVKSEEAGFALEEQTEETAEPSDELSETQVEAYVSDMTLEEKVAQMFMVTPEALAGDQAVTAAEEEVHGSIERYPVGGFIYFERNLVSPEQVKTMLQNTKSYYKELDYPSPFLAVDEEGGKVARIGNNPGFCVEQIETMSSIGASGDVSKAVCAGQKIGTYLSELGFNMDMAPDADVLSNASNTVIGNRSFGSDANLVAEMVVAEEKALNEKGILPVIKHFPGHGATEEDSHEGYAYTKKTLDELLQCELIPFSKSIDAGGQIIMVGHISAPNVTGDELPSSLSSYMVTNVLRGQLGYDGIVITDAMNMGAVTDDYDSATAAVMAVKAGVDIVLMPEDFENAYTGVLDAVKTGEISENRINESVKRILRIKLSAENNFGFS